MKVWQGQMQTSGSDAQRAKRLRLLGWAKSYARMAFYIDRVKALQDATIPRPIFPREAAKHAGSKSKVGLV